MTNKQRRRLNVFYYDLGDFAKELADGSVEQDLVEAAETCLSAAITATNLQAWLENKKPHIDSPVKSE